MSFEASVSPVLVIVALPAVTLTEMPVPAVAPMIGSVTPEPLLMPRDWPVSERFCISLVALASVATKLSFPAASS